MIPDDPGPLVAWRGKYLEDMTREELIAALRESWQATLREMRHSMRRLPVVHEGKSGTGQPPLSPNRVVNWPAW